MVRDDSAVAARQKRTVTIHDQSDVQALAWIRITCRNINIYWQY